MKETQKKEIVNILSKDGLLNESFFEKSVTKCFNKQTLKKSNKLKEWDNYIIQDNNFVVSLTIMNMSYMAELKAVVIDLAHGFVYSKVSRDFFPKEKVILASDLTRGISDCRTKNANFRFEIKNGERILKGSFKKFYNSPTFTGDLEFEFKVHSEPKESAVGAHYFKDKKHFIYSQKINDLDADGYVTVNGKMYTFDKDLTYANCLLARGVMPYNTKWVLSSLNTKTFDGDLVAFNIGQISGKGDVCSENIIFHNGKIEKVSNIRFYIQRSGIKTDYLGGWTFYSEDGKLELLFEPILQVKSGLNALVLKNRSRMVLGRYSGKLTLDSGKVVEIDRALGFSEKVVNKW